MGTPQARGNYGRAREEGNGKRTKTLVCASNAFLNFIRRVVDARRNYVSPAGVSAVIYKGVKSSVMGYRNR